MRLLRPLLLSLPLLAFLLAGCTGTPPDEPSADRPGVVTDPDDYSYLRGNDSGAHIHDYWGGREQIVVVAELEDGFTTANRWMRTEPIRPLEELTFPQGTGHVTMKVGWDLEPQSRYDEVELWVKTAADHEALFLTKVENGDTVEMIINNTQNDVPHTVLSNWYFELRYKRPMTDVVMDIRGVHRVEATLHRTLDLPLFPAHPDHWHNETNLLILNDGHESIAAVHHPRSGGACTVGNTSLDSSCFYTHVPPNGTIVPPETEHVEVVLEHDAYAEQELFFAFHGSNTWRFTIIDPDETEGGRQVYRIPMDETRPDGPYSAQSQWAFEVYTSGAGDETLRPYTGAYTLTVTAHRGTQ